MVRCIALFLMVLVVGSGTGVDATDKEAGLRMIIVRSLEEAKALRQQVLKGASFSALAREKSIGPQRRQWGFSGIVLLDEVQDTLRPVLQKLKFGQVSKPVQLGEYYVIVKLIPAQMQGLFSTAETDLRDGKAASAINAIRMVLKLEPDNVPAHMTLGLAQGEAQQYADAIESLEKARAYAPREAQIPMLLGVMYTHAAEKGPNQPFAQNALQAYRQALSLNQRLEPAVEFGMGKVYATALKEPGKAIEHLQKAAAATPHLPEVHKLLIQAYYDAKRYENAWQQLRLAQSRGFKFPKLTA
ncbi:MAG: peptidylprolyl isomerase, partial [Candidatus Tectomicrobia bacterium]|nr:peptidylprolyl isomerase [Candidatus Tectomicrobia bacterium]